MFRARLVRIIDLNHPLAKLAAKIDWAFLEAQFGGVYADGPSQPPLPTRLMAGVAIRHDLAFDRSSMTRWRQRMGEDRLFALIQESLQVATKKACGHCPARCPSF